MAQQPSNQGSNGRLAENAFAELVDENYRKLDVSYFNQPEV